MTMDRPVCGFVVLLLAVSLARSSPIRGTMAPLTPSAFVGRLLTLNCTLEGSITNDITARDIYFESTNPDVKLKSVVEVVNDRTAKLKISGVYLNMSSSRIACRLGNNILDEVTIVVDEPRFPNTTECIVYNWERMTCTWEMEETDNISISMAYSRSSRCSMKNNMYRCPTPTEERGRGSCSWQPHVNSSPFFFMNHCVWFMARNAYNVVAFSRSTYIVVENFVKPDPVRIGPVKVATDHITLNWTSPNPLKRINYRVAYESRFSNTSVQNTTETSMTLSNLVPNTKYTITIDCIPLVRGAAIGFWSDKETVEVTTEPDRDATLLGQEVESPDLVSTIEDWIVIMQRFDGSLNFNRNWTEYRDGFGEIGDGEFWLGNELVHRLTNRIGDVYTLRIEVSTDGAWYYADYATFSLDSESNKYAIRLSGFSGNASDSLTNTAVASKWYHGGMSFSTWESDNDRSPTNNCANQYQAGWWFNDCWYACLTCPYGEENFNWHTLSHLQSKGKLEAALMMIKRI